MAALFIAVLLAVAAFGHGHHLPCDDPTANEYGTTVCAQSDWDETDPLLITVDQGHGKAPSKAKVEKDGTVVLTTLQ